MQKKKFVGKKNKMNCELNLLLKLIAFGFIITICYRHALPLQDL